ncbi:MAG: SbcC/MukB-like Walker B domain-containing protein [Anaerolineaceae bacterium]
MIPVQIQIEGFLSYQSPATINFESIHLACISGSNGAGKSSILDAITWVLFGIARSRSDDVINQNSKSASVNLTFKYEAQTYKIQRIKEREKPVILELFVFDENGDRWRVLTEHNSTETQKKIVSILRLDYETFINASFFLQGKADQFTILKPSERKEILASILGLEIWETYRNIAREKHKNLELDRKRIIGILDEIELEINQEEDVQNQLSHLLVEEKSKNESISSLITLVDQAKRVEQSLKNLEQTIKFHENEFQKSQQKLDQKKKKILEIEEQIQKLQIILKNDNQIRSDYEKWKLVRLQLEKWEEKREEYQNLEIQKQNYQQQIDLQRNQIDTQLKMLSDEFLKVEQTKINLPLLNDDLAKVNEKISIIESQILKIPDLNKDLEQKQELVIQKREMVKQLSTKNDELREHLKAFQKAGPECPFCNQPLTQEHRKKYEDKVTTEGVERKNQIVSLETNIHDLLVQIEQVKNMILDIQKLDKNRQILEKEKTQIETQFQNLENQILDWDLNKSETYMKLDILHREDNFAVEEKENLLETLKAIETIGYDSQAHQQCKIEENKLRSSENQLRELDHANSTIGPLRNQKIELEQEIIEIEMDFHEKSEQVIRLRETYASEIKDMLDPNKLQKQLDQMQIELNQIHLKIGGENQKLDNISRKKINKNNFIETKNSLSQTIARYSKLEDAFGKNGIPALLIEQALPQIEEHANQLLDKLTGGAMSIRFETQSDYKDKKRIDKKETLDIKINDLDGNTRSYEMFSGGEAFRINFAIRIALSQVLAKRSGAKLQTLIIDEGFGSQDNEGRHRLIDVIAQIKNDFAKILIITHLDELKEMFPAKIEVEKTNLGSRIFVQVS